MATGQHPWPAQLLPSPALPLSPQATLPTMYDLPSEDPEEPGLPDEFHYYQPQLLRETFRPHYDPEQVFVASDLNLYYTVDHPTWHKRPDWFAVLGVSALYAGHDLRLSYVLWQELVAPYLIVELLSPGTEDEDLGRTTRLSTEQPPTQWTVYEQLVGVPYYVVFSRYTDEVHYFVRSGGQYRQITPVTQGLWLPEADLGLGVWFGTYQGRKRQWLRFYDAQGLWIPTPLEQEQQRTQGERQQAEQERQRAEQESQRAERLAAQLRALGIEPLP